MDGHTLDDPTGIGRVAGDSGGSSSRGLARCATLARRLQHRVRTIVIPRAAVGALGPQVPLFAVRRRGHRWCGGRQGARCGCASGGRGTGPLVATSRRCSVIVGGEQRVACVLGQQRRGLLLPPPPLQHRRVRPRLPPPPPSVRETAAALQGRRTTRACLGAGVGAWHTAVQLVCERAAGGGGGHPLPLQRREQRLRTPRRPCCRVPTTAPESACAAYRERQTRVHTCTCVQVRRRAKKGAHGPSATMYSTATFSEKPTRACSWSPTHSFSARSAILVT
jgi:hypothetical protein